MKRAAEIAVEMKGALPSPAGTTDPVVYRCLKAIIDQINGGLFVDLNPQDVRKKEGIELGGQVVDNLIQKLPEKDEKEDEKEDEEQTEPPVIEPEAITIVVNRIITRWIINHAQRMDVITGVQYDKDSKQLQVKTRNVGIMLPGDESDWAKIENGQFVEES